jgi:hypothetical protein
MPFPFRSAFGAVLYGGLALCLRFFSGLPFGKRIEYIRCVFIQDYTALGELLGVFITSIIILELFVFFIIAAYKLVQTRRLAWFLTFGVIAVPVGAIAFSLLVRTGVLDLSQQPPPAQDTLRPVSFQDNGVESKHMAYRIGTDCLGGWSHQKDSRGLDFCLKSGSIHFGVLSEKLQFGSLEHMRRYLLDSLDGLGCRMETHLDERLEIAGREWVHVEALVYVDGFIPQHYDLYGYTGAEGSVQLMGWMGKNEYAAGLSRVRDLASSFIFINEQSS